MAGYTRSNPSPRYQAMLAQYRQLHAEGDPNSQTPAEQMFDGRSLLPHIDRISKYLRLHQCASLLDYGCGKAKAYSDAVLRLPDGRQVNGLRQFWAPLDIRLYDPGQPAFDSYPSEAADGVICSDVLEHVPEEDVPWVIDELFRLSRRFVFATIAFYPAKKTLPSGENAHVTLKPPAWWLDQLERASAAHGSRDYYATVYCPGPRRIDIASAPTPAA
ncbi:hypothetical protein [Ferrovibrio sp.]|uniref:hypothetical protein n=1 Tax=Ferrovibrio sp. TaxID=1917215 RepID=UPI003D098CB9